MYGILERVQSEGLQLRMEGMIKGNNGVEGFGGG